MLGFPVEEKRKQNCFFLMMTITPSWHSQEGSLQFIGIRDDSKVRVIAKGNFSLTFLSRDKVKHIVSKLLYRFQELKGVNSLVEVKQTIYPDATMAVCPNKDGDSNH